MKRVLLIYLFSTVISFGQNPLLIPPLETGNSFNLVLDESTHQFYNGINTSTMGANGPVLGPTLLIYRDSAISILVNNDLADTTTIHWHGLHVAPEDDGGPHSTIPPGTSWNPEFTVLDKAGINWYHPHLHKKTNEHVAKGIAGLIIVRDAEEQALGLPDSYGIDDFPLVLQTKAFDSNTEIEVHTEMDTVPMANATVDAVVDFPAQVVRLRVLNGASQRVMEIGFSDNRSFELIGTDGGLLSAPVSMTRYRMAPGQRADILLDLNTSLGQNFQLMSFGSELPNAIYGAAQPGMGPGATSSLVGYTSNQLNGNDYSFLDINVVNQTTAPVLTIPSTLASFTPLLEGSEDITRNLTFTSAGGMGNLAGPFLINGQEFDMSTINYTVSLDNIEIWSITNQTPIAHPFHIHDVQFFILDINGNPPPPELQGYNDVVLVPAGMGNVRFIAEFNDHSSDSIPYMYHCHMLTHEDDGMMGQFLVVDPSQDINEWAKDIQIYPNPTENIVWINGIDQEEIIQMRLYNLSGKLVDEFDTESFEGYFDLQHLEAGIYVFKMKLNKGVVSKKIVIE